MKLLMVADPIERLKPKGDSSLVFTRTALQRRHEVYWCLGNDVAYSGDVVTVRAAKVTDCQPDALPKTEGPGRLSILDFDMVLVRKDPPFDLDYVRLCWLLALAEQQVMIWNRPSLLLRYHEKLIPLEARAQGFLQDDDVIPTHIFDFDSVRSLKKVVTKPFLGFGGGGIELVDGGCIPLGAEIAQPFQPEVAKSGDRRVFFLGGKLLAHFVRMPKRGDFISNLAQGGSAVAAPLSEQETAVLSRLGKFLEAVGIEFAGADVIDAKISEVNITSPTGLQSLKQLEGKDYSEEILNYFERSAARRTR